MYRTREARGGFDQNRTLHESPATASPHSATPKKKKVPCFSDLRATRFFLNGKEIFLFGVLPSKYSGSVAGLQFELGFAKTIFWGKGFRKTSANLFFAFCPRGGGVWGGIRAGF